MKLPRCSFEVAKALKKIGFYLERTLHYSTVDGYSMYFGNDEHLSNEEIKHNYLSGEFKDFDGNEVYIIETLALIQLWIEEVHGISIDTSRCNIISKEYDFTLRFVIDNTGHSMCSMSLGYDNFNSRNKAIEASVSECIKLIKTKQED